MKLLAAGATAVTLGLLTAGCSGGSGSKPAAASSAGGTSAAGVAAASSSGVTTSTTTGPAPGSSSAPPTGAGPTVTGNVPSSAAASTASAPAGASGSKSTGATTGGKGGPVAVCTTLPTAQVASLSGRALTSSREQDFADDNNYTCAYFIGLGTGGLSLTVKVVGGQTAYANTLSTDTTEGPAEHVTTVTGFGDKAFSAQDGVHVLFGDQMFSVAGVTAVPTAEAIIQALRAKLQ